MVNRNRLVLISLIIAISFVNSQFQERIYPTIGKKARRLFHTHLQTASVYGNSTDLMYYFTDLFIGSQKQKQSLIIDTGSGATAFPCEGYCINCGTKHLNKYYNIDNSTNKYILDCTQDEMCTCTTENRCDFQIKYGESSMYKGFIARDRVSFSEDDHEGLDAFKFNFACVTIETNLFSTQKADGIIGLTRATNHQQLQPIYQAMFMRNLIDSQTFSICMGRNGGYFQMGGYDSQGHLDTLKWIKLQEEGPYNINMKGIKINNHLMANSDVVESALVDSGTTFTYLTPKIITMLNVHFDWFCNLAGENHCAGKRIKNQKEQEICFYYNDTEYPPDSDKLKQYFMTYPILTFMVEGKYIPQVEMNWYPSEYLYRDKGNKYCMAIDTYPFRKRIVLGGTFMKQNNWVFDIDNDRIGYARAECSPDVNQIKNTQEMIDFGQRYGIDKTYEKEGVNNSCTHIIDMSFPGDTRKQTKSKTSNNRNRRPEKSRFEQFISRLSIVDYVFMSLIGILVILIFSMGIFKFTNRKRNNNQKDQIQQETPSEIELQQIDSQNQSSDNINRQNYQDLDKIKDISFEEEDNEDEVNQKE